jgi:hypothetical protein
VAIEESNIADDEGDYAQVSTEHMIKCSGDDIDFHTE